MILKSNMTMMRNNQAKKYNLFFGNPELTRNVWQEFTLQRFLVISIVWILIVLAIYVAVPEWSFYSRLGYASFGGCLLVGIFWGSKLINDSLLQEFTEGTWDSQRMSGLTALQLVIGKLFGSSIMAWYAILLLLCSFLYSIFFVRSGHMLTVLQMTAGMVLFILAMHLFAMFSLLMLWRKQDRQPGKGMRLVSGIPFLAALLLIYFPMVGIGFRPFRAAGRFSDLMVTWFSFELPFISFGLLVLLFSVIWLFIGVWQQMRVELQFRLQPWWWLGFLFFWLFLGAGFIDSIFHGKGTVSALSWFIYLLFYLGLVTFIIYMQLLYARKDAMFWLRFCSAWRNKNYAVVRHLFPGWLTSVLFGLVLAGVLLVLILFVDDFSKSEKFRGVLVIVSCIFFVLRDIALSIWLNLSGRQKRADTAWLFYLVVLYSLLPWLFSEMVSPNACYVFWPLWMDPFVENREIVWFVLSPIVQTLLMMVLVWRRWSQRKVIPVRLPQTE